MNSYLEQLVELLPPDVAKPTEAHIATIQEIDGAVSETRLVKLKSTLDSSSRRIHDLGISQISSFNGYKDTDLGVPPPSFES